MMCGSVSRRDESGMEASVDFEEHSLDDFILFCQFTATLIDYPGLEQWDCVRS